MKKKACGIRAAGREMYESVSWGGGEMGRAAEESAGAHRVLLHEESGLVRTGFHDVDA